MPASPGSTYLRTDGSVSNTLYVKESANDNTSWDPLGIAGVVTYGKRVAYSAVTSSILVTSVSNTIATPTVVPSGPSITLPSDSHTYRVTLRAPSVYPAAQQIVQIGIGTGALSADLYAYSQIGYSGELNASCYVEADVVGTGQTINCYVTSGSGGNVTLAAQTYSPASLSAILIV